MDRRLHGAAKNGPASGDIDPVADGHRADRMARRWHRRVRLPTVGLRVVALHLAEHRLLPGLVDDAAGTAVSVRRAVFTLQNIRDDGRDSIDPAVLTFRVTDQSFSRKVVFGGLQKTLDCLLIPMA